MISLKNFIYEQLEPTTIKNVKVVYDARKEYLAFSVPETYSENDLQIYLGDRFLDDLPSGPDKAGRFFGKNAENIDDAYFEYESYSKTSEELYSGDIDIEWDSKYDESKKDTKLSVYKIKKLTYNILFNEFEIMSNNRGDDAEYLIEKIFKATESSELNKYAIDIVFNRQKTEFEKIDNIEK